MPLKVNDKAPDFSLPSTSGSIFSLKSLIGIQLIIYFYPKDFTGGCTTEVCEFRDHFEFFKNLDITIVGISKDNMETHLNFKQAYHVPFELLTDSDGTVAKLYRSTFPLVNVIKRTTYLLDKEHKIIAVYDNLFNAKKHIREMIEKLKNH